MCEEQKLLSSADDGRIIKQISKHKAWGESEEKWNQSFFFIAANRSGRASLLPLSLPESVTWIVCFCLCSWAAADGSTDVLLEILQHRRTMQNLEQTHNVLIYFAYKITSLIVTRRNLMFCASHLNKPELSSYNMSLCFYEIVNCGSVWLVVCKACLCAFVHCAYLCVCLYILQGMWEFMFLFSSVLLWPGSCELMRVLLSPRLNSSIIHKPPCQQPGWIRVRLCTHSRYAYEECSKVMALSAILVQNLRLSAKY